MATRGRSMREKPGSMGGRGGAVAAARAAARAEADSISPDLRRRKSPRPSGHGDEKSPGGLAPVGKSSVARDAELVDEILTPEGSNIGGSGRAARRLGRLRGDTKAGAGSGPVPNGRGRGVRRASSSEELLRDGRRTVASSETAEEDNPSPAPTRPAAGSPLKRPGSLRSKFQRAVRKAGVAATTTHKMHKDPADRTDELIGVLGMLRERNRRAGSPNDEATALLGVAEEQLEEARVQLSRKATSYNTNHVDAVLRSLMPKCARTLREARLAIQARAAKDVKRSRERLTALSERNARNGKPQDRATMLLSKMEGIVARAEVAERSLAAEPNSAELADALITRAYAAKAALSEAGKAVRERAKALIDSSVEELDILQNTLYELKELNLAGGEWAEDEVGDAIDDASEAVDAGKAALAEMLENMDSPELADDFIAAVREAKPAVQKASKAMMRRDAANAGEALRAAEQVLHKASKSVANLAARGKRIEDRRAKYGAGRHARKRISSCDAAAKEAQKTLAEAEVALSAAQRARRLSMNDGAETDGSTKEGDATNAGRRFVEAVRAGVASASAAAKAVRAYAREQQTLCKADLADARDRLDDLVAENDAHAEHPDDAATEALAVAMENMSRAEAKQREFATRWVDKPELIEEPQEQDEFDQVAVGAMSSVAKAARALTARQRTEATNDFAKASRELERLRAQNEKDGSPDDAAAVALEAAEAAVSKAQSDQRALTDDTPDEDYAKLVASFASSAKAALDKLNRANKALQVRSAESLAQEVDDAERRLSSVADRVAGLARLSEAGRPQGKSGASSRRSSVADDVTEIKEARSALQAAEDLRDRVTTVTARDPSSKVLAAQFVSFVAKAEELAARAEHALRKHNRDSAVTAYKSARRELAAAARENDEAGSPPDDATAALKQAQKAMSKAERLYNNMLDEPEAEIPIDRFVHAARVAERAVEDVSRSVARRNQDQLQREVDRARELLKATRHKLDAVKERARGPAPSDEATEAIGGAGGSATDMSTALFDELEAAVKAVATADNLHQRYAKAAQNTAELRASRRIDDVSSDGEDDSAEMKADAVVSAGIARQFIEAVENASKSVATASKYLDRRDVANYEGAKYLLASAEQDVVEAEARNNDLGNPRDEVSALIGVARSAVDVCRTVADKLDALRGEGDSAALRSFEASVHKAVSAVSDATAAVTARDAERRADAESQLKSARETLAEMDDWAGRASRPAAADYKGALQTVVAAVEKACAVHFSDLFAAKKLLKDAEAAEAELDEPPTQVVKRSSSTRKMIAKTNRQTDSFSTTVSSVTAAVSRAQASRESFEKHTMEAVNAAKKLMDLAEEQLKQLSARCAAVSEGLGGGGGAAASSVEAASLQVVAAKTVRTLLDESSDSSVFVSQFLSSVSKATEAVDTARDAVSHEESNAQAAERARIERQVSEGVEKLEETVKDLERVKELDAEAGNPVDNVQSLIQKAQAMVVSTSDLKAVATADVTNKRSAEAFISAIPPVEEAVAHAYEAVKKRNKALRAALVDRSVHLLDRARERLAELKPAISALKDDGNEAVRQMGSMLSSESGDAMAQAGDAVSEAGIALKRLSKTPKSRTLATAFAAAVGHCVTQVNTATTSVQKRATQLATATMRELDGLNKSAAALKEHHRKSGGDTCEELERAADLLEKAHAARKDVEGQIESAGRDAARLPEESTVAKMQRKSSFRKPSSIQRSATAQAGSMSAAAAGMRRVATTQSGVMAAAARRSDASSGGDEEDIVESVKPLLERTAVFVAAVVSASAAVADAATVMDQRDRDIAEQVADFAAKLEKIRKKSEAVRKRTEALDLPEGAAASSVVGVSNSVQAAATVLELMKKDSDATALMAQFIAGVSNAEKALASAEDTLTTEESDASVFRARLQRLASAEQKWEEVQSRVSEHGELEGAAPVSIAVKRAEEQLTAAKTMRATVLEIAGGEPPPPPRAGAKTPPVPKIKRLPAKHEIHTFAEVMEKAELGVNDARRIVVMQLSGDDVLRRSMKVERGNVQELLERAIKEVAEYRTHLKKQTEGKAGASPADMFALAGLRVAAEQACTRAEEAIEATHAAMEKYDAEPIPSIAMLVEMVLAVSDAKVLADFAKESVQDAAKVVEKLLGDARQKKRLTRVVQRTMALVKESRQQVMESDAVVTALSKKVPQVGVELEGVVYTMRDCLKATTVLVDHAQESLDETATSLRDGSAGRAELEKLLISAARAGVMASIMVRFTTAAQNAHGGPGGSRRVISDGAVQAAGGAGGKSRRAHRVESSARLRQPGRERDRERDRGDRDSDRERDRDHRHRDRDRHRGREHRDRRHRDDRDGEHDREYERDREDREARHSRSHSRHDHGDGRLRSKPSRRSMKSSSSRHHLR